MTFYIIFTEGTFRYFKLFTRTLLDQTSLKFCLVTNACPYEEVQQVKAYAHSNERLAFYKYPTDTLAPHAEVLTHLFDRFPSEWFCFMDSDIFATRDFMQDFLPLLDRYRAIYSGNLIWAPDAVLDASFPRMAGRFMRSSNGWTLGSSYFAMYHRKTVLSIKEKFNLSFQKFKWDELSFEVQAILEQVDLKKEAYDTAKVLNLLLQQEGYVVHYAPSKHLHHIGGLSAYFSKEKKQSPPSQPHLGWFSRLINRTSQQKYESLTPKDKRMITADYFAQLLRYLVDGEAYPRIPKGLPNDIHRLLETTKDKLIDVAG